MPEPSPHLSKSERSPSEPGTGRSFADTFRRRPARAPRGLTPGPRVWAVTAWTAAVSAAAVTAVLTVPPLLADRDEDDEQDTGRTVVAAPAPVEPSPSPSPKASKRTAEPSPTEKETEREEPAPVVITKTAQAAPTTKEPKPVTQTKKATRKPSAPQWTQTVVSATNVLSTGESWKTNRIRMTMQADGNLVVYNEHGKPTWAAMSFGEGYTARFQTDGNLCVYNGDDQPVWATNTFGHPGAQLVLRKDGKVVIVQNGTVLWST